MTTLTITPKIADKTARFKGTVAAGEHVAVTIKGGAEWLGEDGDRSPVLRVIDCTTRRALAVFPYWTEDNRDDWPDGVEEPDAWETSGGDEEDGDAGDLACTLNLNTLRMVAAARHMLRVPVLFVLGDAGDPRTLYFCDRYEVVYWPERIGDTVPYDLDRWPKKIDDWTELVTGWTAKLNGMKLTAIPFTGKVVSGVSKNGVTITLNDGDDTTDTVVDLFDGEVSAAQMNTAIAAMGSTKQNTLTFDAIPTNGSNNPVKSGGVYGAVKEVADAVTEHVNSADIHVTATQKTAWTAKYDKPQDGIPKSDLAEAVRTSLGKADTAVQVHQSLDAYVNAAGYDSAAKEIQLKHNSTVVARIDATAFIKDGMVDSVEISGGNLVISFNTDAGIEDIEIPLTDIFNPANYYDKTAADGRFVQKEAGKGLVAVDATLTTQDAAADAKATGTALYTGYTEWVFNPPIYNGVKIFMEEDHSAGAWWIPCDDVGPIPYNGGKGEADSTDLSWTAEESPIAITATRRLVTPTKTSQLMNDGDGKNAFVKTNDTRLSDARTPTAHHATHAANGSDPLVPADIGAASLSDLPYRLVEPGKWEFSGVPEGATSVSVAYDGHDTWTLTYVDSDDVTHTEFVGGSENDLELDFSISGITATRPSLPGHLLDRAGNRVVVTGDTTLTLPAAVPGYLRDFLVRLEISGSTVPTITFSPDGNESVTYETDGDEFPVPDEAGTWSYSFTENCVAHKFAVSLKKVNEVAQGGA